MSPGPNTIMFSSPGQLTAIGPVGNRDGLLLFGNFVGCDHECVLSGSV